MGQVEIRSSAGEVCPEALQQKAAANKTAAAARLPTIIRSRHAAQSNYILFVAA